VTAVKEKLGPLATAQSSPQKAWCISDFYNTVVRPSFGS
jgi:hypothetical protein